MKTSLYDLGFQKGSIYETIVSTFDVKKRPHAAPFGVRVVNSGRLILHPFVRTSTMSNLRKNRCGVINITSNPWLFYKTALKKHTWIENLPQSSFEPSMKVLAPRLTSCDSYIEFAVSKIKGSGKRRNVECVSIFTESIEKKIKPYCRSTFATIESIIHFTRIQEFSRDGNIDEARKLIDLVKHYRELISRVSPKSSEYKILNAIIKHL